MYSNDMNFLLGQQLTRIYACVLKRDKINNGNGECGAWRQTNKGVRGEEGPGTSSEHYIVPSGKYT